MAAIDKGLSARLEQAIRSNVGGLVAETFEQREKSNFRINFKVGKVYRQKFDSLCRMYRHVSNQSTLTSLQDYMAMCQWLVDVHRATLSPKSWYMYRMAIKKVLVNAEIEALISVDPLNRKMDVNPSNSARRVKQFTESQMATVLGHLRKSKSKYADVTVRLLTSVRKLGIRPAEILHTDYIEYKGFAFFKVKTLKSANHGVDQANRYVYRYIPTLHMSDEDIRNVRTTCETFKQLGSSDVFEKLYESIRSTFLATLKSTGLFRLGVSFSIYSARSQFSSDLKCTPLSNEMRSMIMGHNEEHTLRHHYGAKAHGKSLFEANASYERLLFELYAKQTN